MRPVPSVRENASGNGHPTGVGSTGSEAVAAARTLSGIPTGAVRGTVARAGTLTVTTAATAAAHDNTTANLRTPTPQSSAECNFDVRRETPPTSISERGCDRRALRTRAVGELEGVDRGRREDDVEVWCPEDLERHVARSQDLLQPRHLEVSERVGVGGAGSVSDCDV